MRRATLLITIGVLFLGVRAAPADDQFPPDWRGDFGTMTVGWGFWGPAGVGPRTLLQSESQLVQANPGGFRSPYPARAHFNSNVNVFDALLGRQSVLEINEFGTLGFALENYPGGPEKQILIQITFYLGLGAPMNFDVGAFPADPGDPPWDFPPTGTAAVVIDSFLHDDGWQTNSYGISIEPNPSFEGLSINFTQYPAFIDQVVIDTWCVPEPTTFSLLALGSLLLIRRR